MRLEAWWMGEKVNNFIVDATDNGAGNDKFTSTTVQSYTVPDNKRWFFICGYVKRDNSSTLTVNIHNAADKIIGKVASESAGTGGTAFPNNQTGAGIPQPFYPLILNGGEYFKLTFGTAQGSGAEASCVVIEVEL